MNCIILEIAWFGDINNIKIIDSSDKKEFPLVMAYAGIIHKIDNVNEEIGVDAWFHLRSAWLQVSEDCQI